MRFRFAARGGFVDRGSIALLVALAAFILQSPPTLAQEPGRGETVTSRVRPELAPLGARVGGFLLFPRLTLGEEFNDNIFAVDDNQDADFITTITLDARIRSDWNNHALNMDGAFTVGRYADNGSEDFEDFRVGTDGRVDVTRNSNASASIQYRGLHEKRDSPDDERGLKPTEYSVTNFLASYFHRFNRLSFDVGGTVDLLDFDDVSTSTGILNQDDRDRTTIGGVLRAGYDIAPEYEVFARASINTRLYDQDVDDQGLDRDSVGYEFVIGTAIGFSGVTFGDLFIGYTARDYDDAALDTIDGITLGGTITWNVTGLSTLTGHATRIIEETASTRASGRIITEIGVTGDHELLRNLLLNAKIVGVRREYEGIDRDDNDLLFGLGAKYMLNRNLYGLIDYNLRFRDSSGSAAGTDFLVNSVMLQIQTQF